jgi:hypothetical protein
MVTFGEMTLEEAARTKAGNWRSWICFVWDRKHDLRDPENWSIIYTHHRDSGLLDQSNAEVIATVLTPFTTSEDPDVVFESHSHWAVGHVDGFSIRVNRDGEITEAFRAYHGLMERLDESEYGRRAYDAALENIEDAAWCIKSTYDLTDGWEAEAYEWLSSHRPDAVENKDDRGAYPSERDLEDAINAIGYVGRADQTNVSRILAKYRSARSIGKKAST